MNTKTQELVTAGYALAKGLDAESAKLVKALATELAVQRVRADELNKRAVNLAVDNSGLKSWAENRAASDDSFEQEQYPTLKIDWRQRHLKMLQTPATDAFFANIQAQGVDELADFAGKEYQRFVGDKSTQRKWKGIVLLCIDFAAQLRKDAGNE
ncbi:hypothetical protein LVQ79_10290 [Buttiauxella sp. A2-C1_F]|uniref:hypothetical protein n=1 Tax=Buttiauxella sp. A2-C1_F TaxID=2904526 RepID=UPI001E5FA553|nr:hypothetical protein [Buttiauxella sp. A2-C1_F]MCE0845933.1 hypothetical protein [Buttiauxella sp. A2-C1_F]